MTTDSVNYRSVCLYATDLRKLNIRGWGKFFLHSLQATHSIDIIHWLCLFCFDPNGRQCYPLRIINPLYAVSMFIWCQRKDSRVHMGWNILKAPQKPVISVSFLTFALGNRMLVSLVCHNGRQAAKKSDVTHEFISDDILEVDTAMIFRHLWDRNRWKPTNSP